MPSLIAAEGCREGEVIELGEKVVAIGREPGNDLVLDDPEVSRRHALIEPSDGTYFIADLGSDNGTFVNGVPVGRALLLDGDEIRIGSNRFVFAEQPGEGLTPAPVRPVALLERSEEKEDFFVDTPTEAPETRHLGTDELKRAYERLKTLYGILRNAAASADPLEKLTWALNLVREAVEADRLTLIERDPSAETDYSVVRMVTAEGVSSRNRIAISRTVFSYVEKERKPFFCSNPRSDERMAGSDSLRQSGIRSVLCAPLLEGEKVRGFLYADNFVSREPFDKEDLDFVAAAAQLVSEWLARSREIPKAAKAGSAVFAPAGRYTFVTQNRRMKEILETVRKIARADTTFLITGESGTGKELVARLAHSASPRARGPFVCVNCAALPDTLLESELFGHEKGAFTGAVAARAGRFEAACGGTIFLDEIGDISPAAQAKVLRVLQEKEIERLGGNRTIPVDVRIIAATNKDLAKEIRAGKFREDLFYRLNVIRIDLPPLRERLDDLPALVEYFIQAVRSEAHSPVRRASREALEAMARYSWPGNVRELRNVIERAVVLGEGEEIGLDDLPPEVRGTVPPPLAGPDSAAPAGEQVLKPLAEVEREHILRVLDATGWNKKRSAEILGISRSALYEKIAHYSLETQ